MASATPAAPELGSVYTSPVPSGAVLIIEHTVSRPEMEHAYGPAAGCVLVPALLSIVTSSRIEVRYAYNHRALQP